MTKYRGEENDREFEGGVREKGTEYVWAGGKVRETYELAFSAY